MRIFSLLPLLGFLGCLLPVLSGDVDPEVDTSNIPDDVALCAEGDDPLNCTGLHRFCVDNTTSGDKFCGPCINGTIEDFTAPADVEYPYCIFVANITEENFRAAFGEAIELGEIDIAERLAIIWSVAMFISEHNSKFPDYMVRCAEACSLSRLALPCLALQTISSHKKLAFFITYRAAQTESTSCSHGRRACCT